MLSSLDLSGLLNCFANDRAATRRLKKASIPDTSSLAA